MKKKLLIFQEKITSFKNSKFFTPIILFVFSILAFAPLIPFLGFYWDAWPYLWQYHVFGPSGYQAFVASDRPYSAFIFMLITPIFGTNPIYYHIFTLLCRWVCGLAFYWIVKQLWPEKKSLNTYASIFFILYPGFLQQPIAIPYFHHFSHMALFLSSLGVMLASIEKKKWQYWLLTSAGLLAQLSIFSLEYFATLELIRPILIWLILKKDKRNSKQFLQVFRYWIPYLLVLVGFYYWRVFLFEFPTYQPKMLNEFSQGFSTGFFSLIQRAINDVWTVTYRAWKGIFNFPSVVKNGYPATIGYWIFFGTSAIIALIFLFLSEKSQNEFEFKNRIKSISQPLFISQISLFLAGGIFWVTQLPIIIEFAWDRLTLPFIFGVSLLLASFIFMIFKKKVFRIIIATVLIGFSTAFHILNAFGFKQDWDVFRDFFWQLSWRIPNLKENTIILTTDFPLKFYSDNSLTSPLNWTFAPDSLTEKLDYVFYYSDVRLKVGRLEALEKDLPVYQWYRSFHFEGNTSDTVVIRYELPGCVQVLDNTYANAGIIPNLTDLEAQAIPLSNLDRIINEVNNPKSPPNQIFGDEPSHSWCFYFQKADLARQNHQWDTIIEFDRNIQSESLSPRNSSDWLPFIEANIRQENWTRAIELINQSVQDPKYVPGILFTWKRISSENELKPTQLFINLIDYLESL